MALREIFASFDVLFDTSALEKGESKVDSLAKKLSTVVAAFAEFKLVKGIIEWGEHVAEAAREVEFGAIKAGMGVDEFQKLNQVAERYGTTAEQLTISTRLFIRGLSDAHGTMGEFGTKTNHAQHALHTLGVDATQFKGQRLEQILPVIADAFQKMGQGTEATAVGLRLFGHRGIGILPLMFRGGDNLRREMEAMIPVFEKATIEDANAAALAAKSLEVHWKNLIFNAARPLLKVIAALADAGVEVIKWLKAMSEHSRVGEATLIALTAAFTAAGIAITIALWPILAPILAATAALGLLILIIDDFIVFMEGGKSLIGDFLDRFFGPDAQDKVRKFLTDIKDKFTAMIAEFESGRLPNIFELLEKGATAVAAAIDKIIEGIKFLSGKKDELMNGKFGKIVDDVVDWNTSHGTKVSLNNAANAVLGDPFFEALGVPTIQPMLPDTGAGGGRGSVNPAVINQNMVVNGGDPHEVRRAAKEGAEEALQRHLRDALAARGGAR